MICNTYNFFNLVVISDCVEKRGGGGEAESGWRWHPFYIDTIKFLNSRKIMISRVGQLVICYNDSLILFPCYFGTDRLIKFYMTSVPVFHFLICFSYLFLN